MDGTGDGRGSGGKEQETTVEERCGNIDGVSAIAEKSGKPVQKTGGH